MAAAAFCVYGEQAQNNASAWVVTACREMVLEKYQTKMRLIYGFGNQETKRSGNYVLCIMPFTLLECINDYIRKSQWDFRLMDDGRIDLKSSNHALEHFSHGSRTNRTLQNYNNSTPSVARLKEDDLYSWILHLPFPTRQQGFSGGYNFKRKHYKRLYYSCTCMGWITFYARY